MLRSVPSAACHSVGMSTRIRPCRPSCRCRGGAWSVARLTPQPSSAIDSEPRGVRLRSLEAEVTHRSTPKFAGKTQLLPVT
jgi:hypothetical protein